MRLSSWLRAGRRTAPDLPRTIDLTSDAFVADPYPTYRLLRESRPVAATRPAGFLITRHGDVLGALASNDLRNAPSRYSTLHRRNADRYVAASLAGNILPFLDEPDHTLPRRCVASAVHAHLRGFQPIVRNAATELLARYQREGGDDLIAGFSSPFSVEVMCRFLGIPVSDAGRLKSFTQAFFYLFAPLTDRAAFEQVNATLSAARELVGELVEARRTSPSDDLITRLVSAEHGGKRMPAEQVADSALLVFADGVENVEAGIANVLAVLFEDARAMEMIADGRLPMAQAVSEGLRLETPGQLVPRIVSAETEIGDVRLEPETPVFLALASANRDDRVFEAADQVRPGRPANQVLTFGRGQHSCIGGRLASLQIQAAVEAVLSSGLKPCRRLGEIRYRPRLGHRWPQSYPMQA